MSQPAARWTTWSESVTSSVAPRMTVSTMLTASVTKGTALQWDHLQPDGD